MNQMTVRIDLHMFMSLQDPTFIAIGTPSSQQQTATAVVNIDGVKFKVSENGRKLNRLDLTPSSSSAHAPPSRGAPVRCSISRKLYVEGEEYVEDEDDPGAQFIRKSWH